MDMTPLLNASLAIQLHVAVAIISLVLGGYVFANPKGTKRHKALGRVWVAFMAIATISSASIFEVRMWGLFGPIHLLTLLTAVSLPSAIYYVRKGNITAHRKTLLNTYVGGLLIAGTFAFLPGRIMNGVFFGGQSMPGFYLVAIIATLVGTALLRKNDGPRKRVVRS